MAKVTIRDNKATIQTARLLLREALPSDLDDFHISFGNDDVMKYWSNAPHTTLQQTEETLDNMITSPCNGTLDFAITLLPSNSTTSAPTSTPSTAPHHSTTIGKLGIWSSTPFNPEIGFMLAREHWGKGYIVEAMTAWLGWIWSAECEALLKGEFTNEGGEDGKGGGGDREDGRNVDEEGEERTEGKGIKDCYEGARLERIVADVDPRNEASLGVLKRFGFKEIGRAERTFETHLGWCDSIYLELTRRAARNQLL